MDFTRNLKKGTSGEDVLFCKQKLLELGFYGEHITTVSKKTFGADTLEAVKRFQAQAGLTVDGVIGKETWAALFGDTGNRGGAGQKGYGFGQSSCGLLAGSDAYWGSVCLGRIWHDRPVRFKDSSDG